MFGLRVNRSGENYKPSIIIILLLFVLNVSKTRGYFLSSSFTKSSIYIILQCPRDRREPGVGEGNRGIGSVCLSVLIARTSNNSPSGLLRVCDDVVIDVGRTGLEVRLNHDVFFFRSDLFLSVANCVLDNISQVKNV